MGYQKLQVDVAKWPHVEGFIHGPLENLYFRDVHDMLRLPIRGAGINSGCNFAIAHVLLASVSGIATTLCSPGAGGGSYQRAFTNVLVHYYPWDTEANSPSISAQKRKLAQIFWKEFRGPLTHHLGLWTEARGGGPQRVRDRGYFVKLARLTMPDGDGIPDDLIARIERSGNWPLTELKETLLVRADARVLRIERFYWGIREMVRRLTEQNKLMGQAEAFLGRVEREVPT